MERSAGEEPERENPKLIKVPSHQYERLLDKMEVYRAALQKIRDTEVIAATKQDKGVVRMVVDTYKEIAREALR